MVPDRQKVWTDGQTTQKSISLRLRQGITITYTSQLSVMENIRSNGYAFDMENLEWISKAPITVILTDEFTYGGNRTKFAVLIKACKGGSSYTPQNN